MLKTSVLWHGLKRWYWLASMQTHTGGQFESKIQLPGFILGEFIIIVEFIVVLTFYSTGTIAGFIRFSLYFALSQDSPQDYSLSIYICFISCCILHNPQDSRKILAFASTLALFSRYYYAHWWYYCLINLLIVVKVFPIVLTVIYTSLH